MKANPNKRTQRNLRADAATVIFTILEKGQSARECLPAMQELHKDQDKAWLQEMVYGVLRQLPLLQYWLRALLETPLKNKFKITEHLILLGFYQLAFSRVSQHAAVSETVEACRSLRVESMRGLVNGILRNFIRNETSQQTPSDEQINSGLPKWLYKRLAVAYPQSLTDLIQQIENKAPIWLRVNAKKISSRDFQQELSQKGIEYTLSPQHPHALILNKSVDVTSLPGFELGWFAVQDGAAQLAAAYLEPQTHDNILDCCAAPGGKTGHLLEVTHDLVLTALEIDMQRASKIEENLARLGHQATLLIGDASQPQTWWDGKQYDRILLDAPCSATGIIRRHPDIKWLRKASDIQALVTIQHDILDALWPLLKEGGILLYATCSILPEENHQQMAAFLARTANARLDTSFKHDAHQPGRQILPGEQQMDGFYYCRLIKSGENLG
ncbi:16S rRNA (cytosine(967)-C(5))-methyltransferase RsmB [Flavobacterium sp. W21_SRS_FM6]|uniref:16S rRNA (cytosine(967)-C(5))-methyltransferase RsmB n=1 Tax=Flavobacterium sp. W21_SRS_FM6 TaxID=3240268 RepID=UPI003F8E2061